jgi:transcriptional regulator with PAS, ATPase and Fis domain
LESELFGHRKGSFTGAITDKKGLFEEANGGTIFLDEIASMPPTLQSRLLRVLQDKEVRRIGDNFPTYVNVRILAATNESLEKRIKEGSFREDLFYRLNIITINLPPLRERIEDIPLLIAHFLRDKIHAQSGKPFKITRQVLEAFNMHTWPGNIRELENALERACALSETNIIQLHDLPHVFHKYESSITKSTDVEQSIQYSNEASASETINIPAEQNKEQKPGFLGKPFVPLKNFLKDQELLYINQVLAATEGNKEKAAEILGISLATLYRKLVGDDSSN